MIDLFKLHDDIEDKGAYSWIVIDGPEVFINFKLLAILRELDADKAAELKSKFLRCTR